MAHTHVPAREGVPLAATTAGVTERASFAATELGPPAAPTLRLPTLKSAPDRTLMAARSAACSAAAVAGTDFAAAAHGFSASAAPDADFSIPPLRARCTDAPVPCHACPWLCFSDAEFFTHVRMHQDSEADPTRLIVDDSDIEMEIALEASRRDQEKAETGLQRQYGHTSGLANHATPTAGPASMAAVAFLGALQAQAASHFFAARPAAKANKRKQSGSGTRPKLRPVSTVTMRDAQNNLERIQGWHAQMQKLGIEKKAGEVVSAGQPRETGVFASSLAQLKDLGPSLQNLLRHVQLYIQHGWNSTLFSGQLADTESALAGVLEAAQPWFEGDDFQSLWTPKLNFVGAWQNLPAAESQKEATNTVPAAAAQVAVAVKPKAASQPAVLFCLKQSFKALADPGTLPWTADQASETEKKSTVPSCSDGSGVVSGRRAFDPDGQSRAVVHLKCVLQFEQLLASALLVWQRCEVTAWNECISVHMDSNLGEIVLEFLGAIATRSSSLLDAAPPVPADSMRSEEGVTSEQAASSAASVTSGEGTHVINTLQEDGSYSQQSCTKRIKHA